jgi:hypothetical protein
MRRQFLVNYRECGRPYEAVISAKTRQLAARELTQRKTRQHKAIIIGSIHNVTEDVEANA